MQANRTESTAGDDQTHATVRYRSEQDQIEQAVMGLLLSDKHAGPWTRGEVERELGYEFGVYDALVALHGSGLLHLEGQLVIASRAAQRMDELEV